MPRYTERDREEAASLFILQELPFDEIVVVLRAKDPRRFRSLCKKTLLDWADKADAAGETWHTRHAKQIVSLHRANDVAIGKERSKWIKGLSELLDHDMAKVRELEYGKNDKAGATHAMLAVMSRLMMLTGSAPAPGGGVHYHFDQRQQVVFYVDAVVEAFRSHPVIGTLVQQHMAEILETAKVRIRAIEQGMIDPAPTIAGELLPPAPRGEA